MFTDKVNVGIYENFEIDFSELNLTSDRQNQCLYMDSRKVLEKCPKTVPAQEVLFVIFLILFSEFFSRICC